MRTFLTALRDVLTGNHFAESVASDSVEAVPFTKAYPMSDITAAFNDGATPVDTRRAAP